MRCENCASKEAVIKLVRIERGGQVNSTWVCQDCAAEMSPYQAKLLQKPTLESLLKELAKPEPGQARGAASSEPDPCPSCGLPFRAYKATAMLGCPDCYEAFADELERDLMKVHQATRHVGTGTAAAGEVAQDTQRRLRAVREELAEAVESEDFARAAFLRDEAARLEAALRASRDATPGDEPLDDPA